MKSPQIKDCAWTRLEVVGSGRFKDAKLWPGGAREWDWNETGTRHDPGIQPADVEELVEHGAETVVLATGVYERLGVCDETLKFLDQRGVEALVLQTDEAVARYNELAEAGKKAGALIHSTC